VACGGGSPFREKEETKDNVKRGESRGKRGSLGGSKMGGCEINYLSNPGGGGGGGGNRDNYVSEKVFLV